MAARKSSSDPMSFTATWGVREVSRVLVKGEAPAAVGS
jgi:hypothetical protein